MIYELKIRNQRKEKEVSKGLRERKEEVVTAGTGGQFLQTQPPIRNWSCEGVVP